MGREATRDDLQQGFAGEGCVAARARQLHDVGSWSSDSGWGVWLCLPQYLSGGRVAALHRTEVFSHRQGAQAQWPCQQTPLGFPAASPLSVATLPHTFDKGGGSAASSPVLVSSGCYNKNITD